MKKLNLLFTALMLVCCIGTAKAEEVYIDGIIYDVVTKAKVATVISGSNYSGDIVIPSEITYYDVIYSVTSIGDAAFSGCSGLTNVTIGIGVENIGSEAFAKCENLTDVYCLATSVPSTHSGAFNESYPEYMTLHVPEEAINSYKATAPWSSFGTVVTLNGGDYTNVINVPAKAVLVTSNNDTINISCSLDGESVAVYTTAGTFIATTTIENGTATVATGLSKGSVAIVNIADKSIKVIVD
ncbi:MAG: leucine-rich repeat protein [Bacteroidaceae bacterium]|nr:leucine-rich repeat protein [Bacteroidaceae bacterium]